MRRFASLFLLVLFAAAVMSPSAAVQANLLQDKILVTRSGLLQQSIPNVTRGPYLQLSTPTSIVIRWRTDQNSASRVLYGPSPNTLNSIAEVATPGTEHEVTLVGLAPDSTYYYAVGTATDVLAGGDPEHFFHTPPLPGTRKATRIWVLGDSGTGGSRPRQVRDAYLAYTSNHRTDLWIMLGDNAYQDGTDEEHQVAVFDTFPQLLRNSVLWPVFGSHDAHSASSVTQSGPYFDIFTLPAAAEAGGLASGTKAYFSFDYANIHFVFLDSVELWYHEPDAMLAWLSADLAASTQDWVIAAWHHPPYSKGSHDSDTDQIMSWMRSSVLPILENAGVDLVMTGHSHSYERSFLLDGHYGISSTLTSAMIKDGGDGRPHGTGAYVKASGSHQGTVYVVMGSSAMVGGGLFNHPAMFASLQEYGSVVLDVDGDRLDAVFLDNLGEQRDGFTILKPGATPTATSTATASATSTPTSTSTRTTTPTPSPMPTRTATLTPTSTATSLPSATPTATRASASLYLPLVLR